MSVKSGFDKSKIQATIKFRKCKLNLCQSRSKLNSVRRVIYYCRQYNNSVVLWDKYTQFYFKQTKSFFNLKSILIQRRIICWNYLLVHALHIIYNELGT